MQSGKYCIHGQDENPQGQTKSIKDIAVRYTPHIKKMQQRNLKMKQMKNKSSLLQFRMTKTIKKKWSILKLNERTLIHDQQKIIL